VSQHRRGTRNQAYRNALVLDSRPMHRDYQ
jgi:hypothetical protein